MKAIALFLRFAALLDCLLLSYPILAVLEIIFSRQLDPRLSFSRLGLVLLAGFLGALTGWLLVRMKNPPVQAVRLLLAAAPAALFAGCCLTLLERTALHVALVLLCLTFYLIALFFATRPFDEFVGTSFLSFTVITYLLAAVISWFCGAYLQMNCDPLVLTISFLSFLLLYAFISNQSAINRLMGRRHYDLSLLPAGVRRYNLVFICATFLLVPSGLLFQKQIGMVLQFLLRLLGSLLYIFVLLFNLLTWALRTTVRPDEPLPQSSGLPILGSAQEAASTPMVNVFVQWLAVLVIVLFLFSLRRTVWSAVKTAASAIWRVLKHLFTRSQKGKKVRAASSAYFYDTFEALEQTAQESPSPKEPVSSSHIWQRRYRELLKKPQDDSFLQEGYLLILSWLRMRGAPLSPADTTLEILNKALIRLPDSPFSRVTEGYNGVYYGERPLQKEDIASLLQTLRILSQSK